MKEGNWSIFSKWAILLIFMIISLDISCGWDETGEAITTQLPRIQAQLVCEYDIQPVDFPAEMTSLVKTLMPNITDCLFSWHEKKFDVTDIDTPSHKELACDTSRTATGLSMDGWVQWNTTESAMKKDEMATIITEQIVQYYFMEHVCTEIVMCHVWINDDWYSGHVHPDDFGSSLIPLLCPDADKERGDVNVVTFIVGMVVGVAMIIIISRELLRKPNNNNNNNRRESYFASRTDDGHDYHAVQGDIELVEDDHNSSSGSVASFSSNS